MARLLLLLLPVAALSLNINLDAVWKKFKLVHNKQYDDKEETARRYVWEENVAYINRHNLEHDMGMHTFTLGVNKYADLTQTEYAASLLGARASPWRGSRSAHNTTLRWRPHDAGSLPKDVDWRTKGYVTPVKDQGRCGSCWAFSSTGSLEGAHFKATGRLVPLSEQNLVDCCKANAGCNGGWMDNAFEYVYENGGLDTETYYPYQYHETGRCTYNPSYTGVKVSAIVDLPKDETSLQAASATVGPISVAIDAFHRSFQLYRSGVYLEPNCSSTDTDHAVLVVGYGTDKVSGLDYWLVKNSWTTGWGEQGYIRMARNQADMCAIAQYASYPVV